MSPIRFMLVCLATTCALGATASSASAAFSWWVETGPKEEVVLKEGQKQAFNAKGSAPAPFTLTWAGIQVSCTEVTYEEGFIEGLVGIKINGIKFGKCTVTKPVVCTVEGGTIKTSPLLGVIKQSGGAVLFELKAKSGTTFATFKMTGGCPSSVIVSGVAAGEIPNAEVLSKEKAFLFEAAGSTLTISGSSAEPGGKAVYTGPTGWSAH